jgi:hypothetical protein
MSMFDRLTYIPIDAKGIDPIRNVLSPHLRRLSIDRKYVVKLEDQYRPDTISRRFFNSVELWWLILEFNNLSAINDLKVGHTINIPNLSQFNALVSQVMGNKTIIKSLTIK